MQAPPEGVKAFDLAAPESREGRKLGSTLSRYVRRELISPILFTLGTLTTLVLTKDLLSFSDLVINRGFGATVVAWIAAYETIPLLTRTLPFAVLIGTLAALGRLRADHEILSLEAAGIPSHHLLRPVLHVAAVATLIGLLLSLLAVPWAHRSRETTLQHMAAVNPGVSLRPGVVHEFAGAKLSAREVSASGDRLRGVLLWVPALGHTIFAQRGTLVPQENGSAALLLQEVEMLTRPGRETATLRFATFTTILRTVPPPRSAPNARTLASTLSLAELSALIRADDTQSKDREYAWMEVHRRFAIPLASLVFALLAVPLSLCGRRASRATGMIMGLLVTVTYYGFLQLGEGLIQWGIVNTAVGVWLPHSITSGVAVSLLLRERLIRAWSTRAVAWRLPRRLEERREGAPHARHYLLQRYILRQYVQLLCLSFALLLVGYLIIDVLERLDWFARYQATAAAALRFYGARLPLLTSRVVPMALLLATALTVSLLSAHKELIAMRACGISTTRMLNPILLICAVTALLYFALNELVVPRTNAAADRLKAQEIKQRTPETTRTQMAIWYTSGTHVLQAAELDVKLGEALGLSIYELGPEGLPLSRTDARRAQHVGNGIWQLTDPIRIEISDQGLREVPAPSFMRLGEADHTPADPTHLSAPQLLRFIDHAEARGYDTTMYRVDLHLRLAAPFACLLLPMVALLFAIHGPPFPRPATTILVSVGLGVGYILLTGVTASLGYGKVLPPLVTGWAPVAVLLALVVLLASRSRE
ncbi:MAG: LptF/LptG family permease [Candidatus Binatia bacterium]|nr:LptF/LptG family permease [Candidatus Binatia bacterium]